MKTSTESTATQGVVPEMTLRMMRSVPGLPRQERSWWTSESIDRTWRPCWRWSVSVNWKQLNLSRDSHTRCTAELTCGRMWNNLEHISYIQCCDIHERKEPWDSQNEILSAKRSVKKRFSHGFPWLSCILQDVDLIRSYFTKPEFPRRH